MHARQDPIGRSIAGVSNRLAAEHVFPKGPETRSAEPLVDRVCRAKARWLKRVMYESAASSTQKCFAYAVADHLNCVTLDCWPSQARLVTLLGFQSAKTLQRAARGLERIGVLMIKGGGRAGYRYEPVFLPTDEDRIVSAAGQSSLRDPDKSVRESLLQIHSTSVPRAAAAKDTLVGGQPSYERRQRGAIELEIAGILGPNGFDILGRLSRLDDTIVERLCRAHAAGALGDRELMAAKLAAEQVR